MSLITSISGIRGTIGGRIGEGLSPMDIVKFTTAYAHWLKNNNKKTKYKVVVGRDARISGKMLDYLVTGTLMGMGIDVINIGLASTPTTEIAVIEEETDGGIILTASHNPKQWNALKLLNNNGEFISAEVGEEILKTAANLSEIINYSYVDSLGTIINDVNYLYRHVELIKKLQLIDVELIKKANFTVAIDNINSVGAICLPYLLNQLGVKNIIEINAVPNGDFAHEPEPLPENLTKLSKTVVENNADVGFAVDPDVDRLSIISEDGSFFGEEYTLVAIADYVLSQKKGNTVSNLSSTSALRVVTEKHGQKYFSSAVGELNVVTEMKKCNAVIGGEGNGGVILPELHYGRDSLVGIALFLTFMAKEKQTCSEIRKKYQNFYMAKKKIKLKPDTLPDEILNKIKEKYEKKNCRINLIDGVKIEFENEWVHLRKSNTEPIIRIYTESTSMEKANILADKIINEI